MLVLRQNRLAGSHNFRFSFYIFRPKSGIYIMGPCPRSSNCLRNKIPFFLYSFAPCIIINNLSQKQHTFIGFSCNCYYYIFFALLLNILCPKSNIYCGSLSQILRMFQKQHSLFFNICPNICTLHHISCNVYRGSLSQVLRMSQKQHSFIFTHICTLHHQLYILSQK